MPKADTDHVLDFNLLSALLDKQGFVPAEGGGPPMDPAMMGGDPAMMGGGMPPAAPPPMAPPMAAPMAPPVPAGVEPIKPKIDVNVELMQIKKMLAKLCDAMGVQIPAADMVATQDDLTQMAMQQGGQGPGAAAAGGGGAGAIQPIQPIQPMPGAMPKQAYDLGQMYRPSDRGDIAALQAQHPEATQASFSGNIGLAATAMNFLRGGGNRPAA